MRRFHSKMIIRLRYVRIGPQYEEALSLKDVRSKLGKDMVTTSQSDQESTSLVCSEVKSHLTSD